MTELIRGYVNQPDSLVHYKLINDNSNNNDYINNNIDNNTTNKIVIIIR